MRVDDVVYFSPGVRAIDIDFTNTEQLINEFQARIETYYFQPVHLLNTTGNAFAAGVMIMATIDAITYYSIGGNDRIKSFFYYLDNLGDYEEEKRKSLSKAFDANFRNGLIHEGRIKNAGQFSYAYPWLLEIEHDFMIVNPKILQEKVEEYFYSYLQILRAGQFEDFINKFKRQFRAEVQSLQRHYR